MLTNAEEDLLLALCLQVEEDEEFSAALTYDEESEAFAAALQNEEDCRYANLHEMTKETTHDPDASLAVVLQTLQTEEDLLNDDSIEERRIAENVAMQSTGSGRAWLFVEKVLDLHMRLDSACGTDGNPFFSTVAVDDMVFLAEKLLDCRHEFENLGVSATVTLGYHYTSADNLDSIRQDGLMTLEDRTRMSISSGGHGAVYGDGIYTATNPYAFHGQYGEVGLLVAVVLGNTRRVSSSPSCYDTSVNTVIGNKQLAGSPSEITEGQAFFDEIVLRRSSQCLPLIRFCATLISRTDDQSPGNKSVWLYHQELQKIVDECFNDGVETKLPRVLPSNLNSSRPYRP